MSMHLTRKDVTTIIIEDSFAYKKCAMVFNMMNINSLLLCGKSSLLSKRIGILGGIICFSAVISGWLIFPMVLKSQVNGQISLKKGGDMRKMWSKLPFPLDFKVYLFNVTNPIGIQNGEKPMVQEVGPYFYDEWKEKVNLVDNEEDDTVEYNQRVTWHFNPSKSNGLTGDEEFVFPHIVILSMVMITMAESAAMIGMTTKAIDSIFRKPDSIFMKATAREIIFDGLTVNCTVKDFAGSAVCGLFQMQENDLVPIGDDLYKFSLFGHRNGTLSSKRMRVLRGIKNPLDVGRVVEWNNQSAMTFWSGEKCNKYNGTDSTIFHSFLYEKEDVVAFSPELCRSLSARYEGPTEIHGIRANRYTANFGDQSSIPEEKCFCPSPDNCLKKGAMDLRKCVDVPIIATLPHFYLADNSYLKNVTGLTPVQEDHEISLDFEPMTGSTLRAQKRLQFNMFIYPIQKFGLMNNFPYALMPLFWVEEGVELGDNLINRLKSAFRLITIVSCIKWIVLLLGIGLCIAAVILEYKRRRAENKLEVTPMSPTATASAKSSAGEAKKWPMNISTLQSAVDAVPPSVDRN